MQLIIYGQLQTFAPLKAFREAHDLPPDFGIALFERKDFTGLGRIDQAGAELNAIRQAMLALAKPGQAQQAAAWLKTIKVLRDFFQHQLRTINPGVGLKDVEIDFAVAGLNDVLEAVVWALLRAEATGAPAPAFAEIYAEWLNSTVRVSQTIHDYWNRGERWGVQVVTNAYGRVGMFIRAGTDVYCVQDTALACPAEGFMATLLAEIAVYILPSQENRT